jgi:hypothetical protein
VIAIQKLYVFVGFLIALLATAFVFVALSGHAGSQVPAVLAQITSHDYGIILDSSPATFAFPVKNIGKGILLFSPPRSSCGCTQAEVHPERLAPGETGSVIVTVNTLGRIGPATSVVMVPCNDPENSKLLFNIAFSGAVRIAVEPDRIRLEDVIVGVPTTRLVAIRTLDANTHIIGVSASPPFIAEMQSVNSALKSGHKEQNLSIRFLLPSNSDNQLLNTILTIKFDNADGLHEKQVPVVAFVHHDLVCTPSLISLPPLDHDQPFSFNVQLSSLSQKTFEIESVTFENPQNLTLSDAVVKPLNDHAWTLHMNGNGPHLTGAFRFGINIHAAKDAPVTIPVHGRVVR